MISTVKVINNLFSIFEIIIVRVISSHVFWFLIDSFTAILKAFMISSRIINVIKFILFFLFDNDRLE